jgi:hypothetical protein
MCALQAWWYAVPPTYTTGTKPAAATMQKRTIYVKDPAAVGVFQVSNQASDGDWEWKTITIS